MLLFTQVLQHTSFFSEMSSARSDHLSPFVLIFFHVELVVFVLNICVVVVFVLNVNAGLVVTLVMVNAGLVVTPVMVNAGLVITLVMVNAGLVVLVNVCESWAGNQTDQLTSNDFNESKKQRKSSALPCI